MLKLSEIRTPILKGLKAFTGSTVIMADQSTKPPPYPYYTIKLATIGESVGQVAEKSVGDEITIRQVLELDVSVTAFSNKLDESFDKAFEALEWFKGAGTYTLDESNIVVVNTQPITNRDTFINVDYERRHGFDVRLRVAAETTFNVGYIEHISVELD
ncbi:hypothetical protein AAHH17_16455 [Lysinibacillus capsici]|uniref:phage neck terminator protein n=1 Tax=Lysinibacillus capsici TaxID=2115968 RepID=UPI0032E41759